MSAKQLGSHWQIIISVQTSPGGSVSLKRPTRGARKGPARAFRGTKHTLGKKGIIVVADFFHSDS